MNQSYSRHPRLAVGVHAARVALVVALLLAIPSPTKNVDIEAGEAPSPDVVQAAFDQAVTLDPMPDAHGLWDVIGEDGQSIAKVARTLPLAAKVVGYRGPTEALVVLDEDLNVSRVRLLRSSDTQEHVDAVIADEAFFDQFQSWSWGGPPENVQVDAVSGATLTSLALVEGVLKRIGGDRPSLVFPEEISDAERQRWFADTPPRDRLIRTGTLTDDIAGYQGPTELLLQVDVKNQVERIRVRSSFDNEPYVDYVRTERSFWNRFEGKTLQELASFDPEAAGVEGVSGATMTSLAVADTIVAFAKAAKEQQDAAKSRDADPLSLRLRWSLPDIVTIVGLLLLALASWMRWFRIQWFRRLWLVAVFLVVGLWSGNLVSMALIAGWGAQGIAWRLAPGLASIAVVAMLSPAIRKGNPYCNHLCPHGALQQLIRPSAKSRRHLHLSTRVQRILHWIPGVTLTIAYVLLIVRPTIDLSSWEPFHAYLFRIASWSSIALALGSLTLSAFVPMGYCRLGCPTGRLLNFLRRNSKSHQIQWADFVAFGLLTAALLSKLI